MFLESNKILMVAVGGATGSVLRLLAGHFIHLYLSRSFPWGTLTVNVIGSLLIGFCFVLMEKSALPEIWRYTLMIGFMGGFTTFSSFSLESILMLQKGEWLFTLSYVMLSVTGCIASAWVGIMAGHLILR